jgi:hypothetical protein
MILTLNPNRNPNAQLGELEAECRGLEEESVQLSQKLEVKPQ